MAGRQQLRAGGGALTVVIEANPYAYLSHHGASPLVRLRVEADCRAVSADTDARPFNTVFAPDLAKDSLAERVGDIRRMAAVPGRAQDWWIGPAAGPAGLVEQLAALGFSSLAPVRMMTARLTEAAEPAGGGHGKAVAHARPVRSPGDLEDFVAVHGAAYGTDRTASGFFHQVLASLPLADHAPMQHVVVRAAGAPVAVASVFLDDGVAGLYNVATRPGVRGLGFGTAAARAALSGAYDRGTRRAVLGAEPDAVGLYRALGFTDAGLLHRMRYAPGP